MGRLVEPEEVAAAILFLASPCRRDDDGSRAGGGRRLSGAVSAVAINRRCPSRPGLIWLLGRY